MTPFAIAGVQMYVGQGDNLEAMRHRLKVMMHLYPWVQMVLFSELCVFGPGLHQGAAPARPGRGGAARHGRRVRRLAGAGLAVREPRRPHLQCHPGDRPPGQRGRPLPQDVPVHAAGGGRHPGRRVLRVRRAGRRPVRHAQLLRHLVPGDDAHGHRHGRRGDPAPGDDPHHRPRRRPQHRQGQRGDLPGLRVRHQRPGRRRQRPVLHPRPGGPGAAPGRRHRGDDAGRDRSRPGPPPAPARHAHHGPAAEELPRQHGAFRRLRCRVPTGTTWTRSGRSRSRRAIRNCRASSQQPVEALAAE